MSSADGDPRDARGPERESTEEQDAVKFLDDGQG